MKITIESLVVAVLQQEIYSSSLSWHILDSICFDLSCECRPTCYWCFYNMSILSVSTEFSSRNLFMEVGLNTWLYRSATYVFQPICVVISRTALKQMKLVRAVFVEWHFLQLDNFSTIEHIARIHHFLKCILKYLHSFTMPFKFQLSVFVSFKRDGMLFRWDSFRVSLLKTCNFKVNLVHSSESKGNAI